MNKQHYDEIYEYIRDNRRQWYQGGWHNEYYYENECLTCHCIAGFAEMQLLGISFSCKLTSIVSALEDRYREANVEYNDILKCMFVYGDRSTMSTRNHAVIGLQLTQEEASWLFSGGRTFDDLTFVYEHGIDAAITSTLPNRDL